MRRNFELTTRAVLISKSAANGESRTRAATPGLSFQRGGSAVAGANQHDIPQALSRGFRIPGGSKKGSEAWLYEKGVAPRRVRIKDEVAVEPYFYSEPSGDGSKTLDDEITDYENTFARRLQTLKSAPPGTAVDADTAAEVVAHLTIRNAHLRRTFTMGVNSLLGRAVEVFSNEATLRPVLGVDRDTPSERVKELIDEQIKENPALAASGLPPRVLYQIAQMFLKERFSTFFATHVPFMAAALGARAPAVIRDGHNKVLSTGLAPDGRTEVLRALEWRVLPCPDDGFVLPDCVALGVDDETGPKPLILADLDKVTVVLMPLATKNLLVGTRHSAPVPPVAAFNEAAAAASHTFFIAARRDDPLTLLADRIGATSGRFMNETIGSTFSEFLHSRSPEPTAAIDATAEEQPSAAGPAPLESSGGPSPPAPQYSIHFLSCVPDQATADKAAAALYAITGSLVQMMPLDRLDGFTFASDYPAALRNLDRGFPAKAPLEPTAEEYGVGISMAPSVVRAGIVKTHIVMRGDIAHALISEDETHVRFALHTVVGQLAYAACSQILDEALPGFLLKKIEDPYDAFLYSAIHGAWTGYFSSRASAAFDPEAGLAQQNLLVSVLKRAQSDIPAARLAYRVHGDIDALLAIVLPRIADVLRFSGMVVGHYDGLQRPFLDEPALAAALDEMNLRDWLLFFDSDLSRLWNRRGKWASIDEFFLLNRHVERLFWQYHLFPWRTDEGRIRIEAPLASDAAQLAGFRPLLRRIGAQVLKALRRHFAGIAGHLRRQSI
jgi:hypothetical protein